MISEHQFAKHYSSVWNVITPLADGFWRAEKPNIGRIHPPLSSTSPNNMRAVLNETAFRIFCSLQGDYNQINLADIYAEIDQQLQQSISYVQRFSTFRSITAGDIDRSARDEISTLAKSLLRYFDGSDAITLQPRFRGCGIISACEGDVIEGSCLYEIKAGDRSFRVGDLRQLLIYAALAYANDMLSFTDIGLFNPRTGQAWRKSLEEVSYSLSGLRLSDTMSALVEQFTGASASR